MKSIEILHRRVSSPLLDLPAPDTEELELLYKAAARAADHGRLKPYRFLKIENEGLDKLGDVFLEAVSRKDEKMTDELKERYRTLPRRAPLILVAIADKTDQPKVPGLEKIMCGAAAVQNLINAAFMLDYGAFWRTGSLALDELVHEKLGVKDTEELLGFIYIGTPSNGFREITEKEQFCQVDSWS